MKIFMRLDITEDPIGRPVVERRLERDGLGPDKGAEITEPLVANRRSGIERERIS